MNTPGNANPGNANLPIRNVPRDDRAANQEIRVPSATPKGYHSRGYLPHIDSTNLTQHITLHLADSLPEEVLTRFAGEIEDLPEKDRHAEKWKRIAEWLDAGHGSCLLKEPELARMVQGAILYFDGERYRMLEWVIMPNHVHILFQPTNGWTLTKIVASWKKFTARGICDWLDAEGADRNIGLPDKPVWHPEYWDRYMRDEYHFHKTVNYIHQNPVKARLAAKPEDWPWSSASVGNANLPIRNARNGDTPANQEIRVPKNKHP